VTYDDRDRNALDRLEDMLDAYADARLTPSSPILRRMRAHVLAQAVAVEASQAASVPDAGSHGLFDRIRVPRLTLPRRALAIGMAATLTVGATAAVAGAVPGTPFYEAKVAIQDLFLPTHDGDRLVAHEQHLADRIGEAEAAAARRDTVALEAALAAYRGEVEAALADVGADPGLLTQLQAVLNLHVTALEQLSLVLQSDDADGAVIAQAIHASQDAVEKIKDKTDHANNRPSVPPGQGSNPPNRP